MKKWPSVYLLVSMAWAKANSAGILSWFTTGVEAEEAVFADNYENALEAYLNLNALDPQTYLQKLRQEFESVCFL